MEKEVLHIKNMVCRRCKMTVEAICLKLGVDFESVSLGEVILKKPLEPGIRESLNSEFSMVGFEILEDRNEKIVNRIKTLVIKEVYQEEPFREKNLSVILTDKLIYDYSFMSGLFTEMEEMSIAKFQSNIRIERAKELLEYAELNVNEIAAKLGYKRASYFCTKFKKETGFSPLAYQREHIKERQGISRT